MDEPDLRPSPWPLHVVTVTIMVLAYGVLAWEAWPASPAQPPQGGLQEGLSVVVAVGQGAAAASLIAGGGLLMIYVAVSTAAVARVRNPWLVHGVLLAVAALAIGIANL